MRALSMEGTLLFLFTIAFGAGCSSSGVAEPRSSAAPPRQNTCWRLLKVDGRPARVAAARAEPYLQRDPAQKQAHGRTGCNVFSGPYEPNGDSLRLAPLVSTWRACLDPKMSRQGSAFLHALGVTRPWRISGDTLILLGETGEVVRFAVQYSK